MHAHMVWIQKFRKSEISLDTGVTFSDSDSASIFLNPDPGIYLIWEFDSCSDSGYNRGNRKIPMVLLQKWPRRILLQPKLKSDSISGPGFSKIFDPGFERKTQNPAGVDSGSVAISAYNTTTTVQFQPSQLKFSLLQVIPEHAIIILRAHNIA